MTDAMSRLAPQTLARTAGALYLVIIVAGIWSEMSVRVALIVPGDAAATAANVLASQGLFRASFIADTIMALSDVILAVLLYVIFRPVGPVLALSAMVLRLIQAGIIAVSLLHQHVALLLLTDATYSALDPASREALAALAIETHAHGYDLGLIFFALNCLALGRLIMISGYFPKWLGLLVGAAGIAYLIGSYTLFLAPDYAATVAPVYFVSIVAEVAFCLWLLIRGIDSGRWAEAAAAARA
jgi:Domain of unknown function (DUF4386)